MIGRLLPVLACTLLPLALSLEEAAAQNVLVTYYSQGGHTRAMAESVAAGAGTDPRAEVRFLPVDRATQDDVLWADAIIVGTPVHGANVAAPVQTFISQWPYLGQPLKDKIGAAFVTGGGISTGEELTLLAILHSMLVYNMIVVGGPANTDAFGASAVTGEAPFAEGAAGGRVDPMFLAKAEGLGRRVAEVARRFERGREP